MWLTPRWPIKIVRRPGQRVVTLPTASDKHVVTLPVASDNEWWHSTSPWTTGVHHSAWTRTTLEHFSLFTFCLEFDSKMFSPSTRTTGDKHYVLPRTTGGDDPAAPDNGWQLSALPQTTGTLTPCRPGQQEEHEKLIISSFYEKIFRKSGLNQPLACQTGHYGKKRGDTFKSIAFF